MSYLIKKYGFEINKIEKEENISKEIISNCVAIIIEYKLYIESYFNDKFAYFRTKDYLYDYSMYHFKSNKLMEWKYEQKSPKNNSKNITIDFYDGFGISCT